MWQSSLFYSYDTSIIKNSENQSKPASYNSRHIVTTHTEIRVLGERCDKMKKMVKRHIMKKQTNAGGEYT